MHLPIVYYVCDVAFSKSAVAGATRPDRNRTTRSQRAARL